MPSLCCSFYSMKAVLSMFYFFFSNGLTSSLVSFIDSWKVSGGLTHHVSWCSMNQYRILSKVYIIYGMGLCDTGAYVFQKIGPRHV